nr:HAD hydrolase-like protein [Tessaracoccus coleopterorum]
MQEPFGVFDAVIFDFDGTLADSHASMMTAYGIFAEEYGIALEEMRRYTGMPTEAVARALLPADIAPAAGRRIDELECSNTDGVVALPGALAALESIPEHRKAIATSCTTRLITARMGRPAFRCRPSWFRATPSRTESPPRTRSCGRPNCSASPRPAAWWWRTPRRDRRGARRRLRRHRGDHRAHRRRVGCRPVRRDPRRAALRGRRGWRPRGPGLTYRTTRKNRPVADSGRSR